MVVDGCRITFKSKLSSFTKEVDRVINKWLEESAGELEGKISELSRVDTGQTKGSYHHVVDTNVKTAYIGSDLQNAVWEEFGTGEYALDGNGRKGYWVYVKGSDGTYASESPKRYYTKEKAMQIMAILRSKGLEAYYTNGKTPNRPIFRAFNEKEQKIVNRIRYLLRNMEIEI